MEEIATILKLYAKIHPLEEQKESEELENNLQKLKEQLKSNLREKKEIQSEKKLKIEAEKQLKIEAEKQLKIEEEKQLKIEEEIKQQKDMNKNTKEVEQANEKQLVIVKKTADHVLQTEEKVNNFIVLSMSLKI